MVHFDRCEYFCLRNAPIFLVNEFFQFVSSFCISYIQRYSKMLAKNMGKIFENFEFFRIKLTISNLLIIHERMNTRQLTFAFQFLHWIQPMSKSHTKYCVPRKYWKLSYQNVWIFISLTFKALHNKNISSSSKSTSEVFNHLIMRFIFIIQWIWFPFVFHASTYWIESNWIKWMSHLCKLNVEFTPCFFLF